MVGNIWRFSNCKNCLIQLGRELNLEFQFVQIVIRILFQALLIAVDTFFYGKVVFASLNIILYNVFSSHGPDLYGTEGWHFYFINCFLNFNLVFLASLSIIPIMVDNFFRSNLIIF